MRGYVKVWLQGEVNAFPTDIALLPLCVREEIDKTVEECKAFYDEEDDCWYVPTRNYQRFVKLCPVEVIKLNGVL